MTGPTSARPRPAPTRTRGKIGGGAPAASAQLTADTPAYAPSAENEPQARFRIFWTPKTSCRPAATRNSTAAWKTPPSTMLRLCAIRAPEASHAPRVDPVVEPGAARLLDLLRGHHLHGIDRHEVVAVLFGGGGPGVALLPDLIAAVA